ncbi:MAG TPA: translocation/assembly module TamB domain-containing protein [Malonomonas sp.]
MSQPDASTSFKSWLHWAVYLLLLSALFAVLLLLGTHSGNQALLRFLPRLEPRLSVTLERGLLLGDASVSQLRWSSPGVEIDIPRADWSWNWQGVWQGNLSLDRLHSQGASIVIAASSEEAAKAADEERAEPFELPFSIELHELRMEQTRVDVYGDKIELDVLQGAARLDQQGLRVSALELQDLQILLAGLQRAEQRSASAPATADTPGLAPKIYLPFPVQLDGLQLQNGRFEQAGLRFAVERLQLSAEAQPFATAGSAAGENTPYRIGLQHLQLEQVSLDLPGQKIALKQLQLAAALIPEGLSVSPLKLQDLRIVLAAEAKNPADTEPEMTRSDATPIHFPEVTLPFPIRLEGLSLQNGRFEQADESFIVEQLQLSARGQQAEIQLQQLTLEIPQAALRAQGKIALHKSYPLDLQIEATRLTLPPFTRLTANLLAGGSLEDLKLELKTVGELNSQLTGRVNLLDPQLPYSAQVAWQEFGWPLELPQYFSESGRADIQGTLREYRFEVAAQVSGDQLPALSVAAKGQGDDRQLSFAPLEVDVYQGQVAATGTLGFAEGVDWRGTLTFADINPAELRADLPGKLSGSLHTEFNLQDDDWSLQLQDIKLAGVLAEQRLKLQGQVSGNQRGEWQITELELLSGDNHLLVNGQIGEQADLQGTLQVVDLQQSIPQAAGRLAGSFKLTGAKASPLLDFSLSGEQLAYAGQRVAKLKTEGQVQLSSDPRGKISLQLEDGLYQGILVEQLELLLAGDLQNHQLALELYGEQLSLQSSVQGQYVEQLWRGQLRNSWAQTPFGRWEQDVPSQLLYDAEQRQLIVERHCWHSDDASLCLAEDASIGAEGDLSLRLDNFAGSRLAELLAKGFVWQGMLSATADAHWAPEQQPRAHVELSAGSGSFEIVQDGQTVQADYQQLALTLTLAEGLANSRLQLQSAQLGRGEINLQLSLLEKERSLQGQIDLAAFQLKFLQPLIAPFTEIAGSVDAEATIGGTLKRPLVSGAVALSDGQLKGPSLPTSLEQIGIRAEFNNDQAEISGELLLGKGLAQLEGVIDWQQPPATGWLTLKGARHRFSFEPGMTLLLSPDLRLDYQPELLEVSGTVVVPYGRIKLKQLPKGAVNRSADVVIVDAPKRAKKQQLLPLALDLDVILHDDVKIDAFGLKADLEGELAVKQAPAQPLAGNGSIELQKGSYKAFGQNLQINKGLLLFAGPIGEPFVDVDAIRNPDATSDNVIAGLRLRGAAKNPKITIYSEPAMAQQEALSYLLRGRSLASSSDTSQDTTVATALLGAGLGSSEGIISDLGQALGVRELAVDTRGEGSDTKVAVSGYLLPGVQVSYGVGVFSPATEITLRYEILPKLMLEAISGLRSAVDLLYEFEF